MFWLTSSPVLLSAGSLRISSGGVVSTGPVLKLRVLMLSIPT